MSHIMTKYNALHTEALVELDRILPIGKVIELYTEEDEKEDDDGLTLYDLPQIGVVDKYSNYGGYGIVMLKRPTKEDIVVECNGIGECSGESICKDILELSYSEIIWLVDYLLENKIEAK